MGLFNKDEDVPEIPTAPILPKLTNSQNDEKKELPELPSFPQSTQNENLNQEIVKSAVADNTSPEEKKVDANMQKSIYASEVQKEGPIIPPKPSEENIIPKLPSPLSITDFPKKTLEMNPIEESPTRSTEPIFIRIDKFQSAQRHFEQIKTKINEIEAIIGKIKETKSKEEVELKGWAEDVERIKLRLSEIDSDIFDQI